MFSLYEIYLHAQESWSWDEMLTWKPGMQKNISFYAKSLTTEQATCDIVWMPLRRGTKEPRIGSAQVSMPLASVAPYHGCCS